ncbi:MAG: ABC transporter permease [Clostridiales bacterium]|nr:ABC transporter permease [Clostridiales bacterium]
MTKDTRADWDIVIRPRRRWFDIDLKGVVQYRDLIWLLVKRYFSLIYRQTVLGPIWIVLQPLLTTTIFTVVFGNIAGLPTDGMPKFLFYMAGNILWQFFSKCLTDTSNTFIGHRNLFGKVYFPRLCMPISTVLGQLINFMVQFALFLGFVAYYATRPDAAVRPQWRLIALTPLMLLQLGLMGLGFGVIVSALTTRYRDLAMLVSFGTHLWMYFSPVTYASSMVAERYPALAGLYQLNPITPVIDLFRAAWLGAGQVQPKYSLISAATTLVVLFFGVLLFSHTEKTFMDTV